MVREAGEGGNGRFRDNLATYQNKVLPVDNFDGNSREEILNKRNFYGELREKMNKGEIIECGRRVETSLACRDDLIAPWTNHVNLALFVYRRASPAPSNLSIRKLW